MELETILIVYCSIAGICAFVLAVSALTGEGMPDGIDNLWDFVVYNVLWIVQPIKAIFKFFKNI